MSTNQQSNITGIPAKNKKVLYIGAGIIFLAFAFLYVHWVLTTYRNIVHMDIINIISNHIKRLYEHNLKVTDFFYQPLFPCTISLTFTFLNAKLFHLNTVVETCAGMFFLIVAGIKFLKELGFSNTSKIFPFVFAFVTGFIIFGFHKWEAALTSFFSFAAFFNLCIIFFSYFFIAKFIDPGYTGSNRKIAFLIVSNLLVIFEATSYYFSFALSTIILLLIVSKFDILPVDKKRVKLILITNTSLLIFAVLIVLTLGSIPALQNHAASQVDIGHFINTFLEKPLWIIQFYLLAHSGPYLADSAGNLEFRTLVGSLALISYGIAIYYFIKKKDKWMLVPILMIIYTIISYSFVTVSRYKFNVIEYGASSRYTAFTLMGALGLASIMVYYIFNGRKIVFRLVNLIALVYVFIFYKDMFYREQGNAPYRTGGYEGIKNTLLTGEHLEYLQANLTTAAIAIEVLKKNKLNVYYNYVPAIIDLNNRKKTILTANTPDFYKIKKSGIHEDQEGKELTWTDGNASLSLDSMIQIADSMSIQLGTYLPPVCKHLHPNITLVDTTKTEHPPVLSTRTGDTFIYKFHFNQPVLIRTIKIISDTIPVAPPDIRRMSFPLLSLEFTKGK